MKVKVDASIQWQASGLWLYDSVLQAVFQLFRFLSLIWIYDLMFISCPDGAIGSVTVRST